MKKTIALLLLAVFLTPFAGCFAAEGAESYDCGFTAGYFEGQSAGQIISTEKSRAELTVLLLLDLILDSREQDYFTENIAALLINTSYVSSDGSSITVLMYSDRHILMLFFNPQLKLANYYLQENDLSGTLKESVIETTAKDDKLYYKNDSSLVLSTFQSALDALTE